MFGDIIRAKNQSEDDVSSAEYTLHYVNKTRTRRMKENFFCLFTPALTYSGNVSLYLKYILAFKKD